MSRLSKELSIIPTVARVLAALIYVGTAVGFWAMFTFGPPGNGAPPAAKFALIFFAGIPLAINAAQGTVNADARRRGMRYIMWTLLAISFPTRSASSLYLSCAIHCPGVCPNCSQLVKRICVPPALRLQPGSGVPELQASRGAIVESLPYVRHVAGRSGASRAGAPPPYAGPAERVTLSTTSVNEKAGAGELRAPVFSSVEVANGYCANA